VLTPATPDETASAVVDTLSEIAHKHHLHQRKLFPFYIIKEETAGYDSLRKSLELTGNTEVIAVNARRSWWRSLPKKDTTHKAEDLTHIAIENWVDSIRLGEGEKKKLPPGLVLEEPEEVGETIVEEPAPEPEPIAVEEPIVVETEKADEPPAPEPEIKHGEL